MREPKAHTEAIISVAEPRGDKSHASMWACAFYQFTLLLAGKGGNLPTATCTRWIANRYVGNGEDDYACIRAGGGGRHRDAYGPGGVLRRGQR